MPVISELGIKRLKASWALDGVEGHSGLHEMLPKKKQKKKENKWRKRKKENRNNVLSLINTVAWGTNKDLWNRGGEEGY